MKNFLENIKKNKSRYLIYLLLCILIYFPVFSHLDSVPIRIWDESRVALNAYEMNKNNDFIVTYYEGNPDMWNTKPPLLVWIQVVLMKFLGVNELAVRLPSAFAAFLTCVLLMVYCERYLKQFWLGFIAVLVLISTHGYINYHASRTGDYDSLLTFFTTLNGICILLFLENKKNKYLYLFFISAALSVLTKSITGLLFMPAIFIFILLQKRFIELIKNKHFYFSTLLFLVTVLGYYLLREFYNPGYLKAVQENELGGRYLEVIEEHKSGFWFYYNNFVKFQIPDWILFIPAGLLVGILNKDSKIRKLTIFLVLNILFFFFVISTAQTKLEWYDVPLYPYLSLMIAIFIFTIFELIRKSEFINTYLKYNILPFIFLFFISINPYSKIINKTFAPQEYPWNKEFYKVGYVLKQAIAGKIDLNNFYFVHSGYNAQNLFYLKILNDKGVKISSKEQTKLEANDLIIAHQKKVNEYIRNNYTYNIIDTYENVVKYEITGIVNKTK